MPPLGHLALSFADSPGLLGNLAEIPIAVTGSWVKDGHRFSITKEDLDEIVSNFEKRGNGQVVVDYEHASERPEVAKGGPIPAAAWIHQLSLKHDPKIGKDVLWASVEWTPKAKEMIQGGEYRFFSPAIDWGANDKRTGKSKGATLTSGALTNHPFLEELPAIQMSEAAKPTGKQIVVPVIDNAKIKVKVDAKHDGDGTTQEMSEAVTKSEGDGDHPSSHYLVVEDPKHPTGWHLRVKDADGKVDHGLMGAAWAALHGGYRGNKYTGPSKSEAISKLKSLYKSEGMKTPEQQEASEVTMNDQEFATALLASVTAMENAKKSLQLCSDIRRMTDAGNVSQRTLGTLGVQLLDDMDAYGVEGDRGNQDDLRKQAEKRAKAIDKPSDGDETETMSAKKMGDDDEDDDAPTPGGNVPRFSIRKMRPADKVGKLKHHAVVDGNGKLAGYITHGDMSSHMAKFAEAGRSQGTLKASELIEEEIKETTGRPLTMSEVTQYVERGINATDYEGRKKAHKLMLSAAVSNDGSINARAARRLLAEDKVTKLDFADFEDAVEDARQAIEAGKFLPKQRASLVRMFLSDRESAEQLVKDQLQTVQLSMVGVGGNGRETDNPDKELADRIDSYIKENGGADKVRYSEAYSKVLASDRNLEQRYKAAHSKLM